MPVKVCTKCGAEKSFHDFGKRDGGMFGLNSVCKKCVAAKTKKYREVHGERVRERERLLYSVNKDAINARKRQARKNNNEQYRATNRKWYSENKDRIREVTNKYRRSRAEFFAAITARHKKENPEIWKRKDRERISKITDGYIRNIISSCLGLSANERDIITKEMIEIKRSQIKLYRELKKIKEYDKPTA